MTARRRKIKLKEKPHRQSSKEIAVITPGQVAEINELMAKIKKSGASINKVYSFPIGATIVPLVSVFMVFSEYSPLRQKGRAYYNAKLVLREGEIRKNFSNNQALIGKHISALSEYIADVGRYIKIKAKFPLGTDALSSSDIIQFLERNKNHDSYRTMYTSAIKSFKDLINGSIYAGWPQAFRFAYTIKLQKMDLLQCYASFMDPESKEMSAKHLVGTLTALLSKDAASRDSLDSIVVYNMIAVFLARKFLIEPVLNARYPLGVGYSNKEALDLYRCNPQSFNQDQAKKIIEALKALEGKLDRSVKYHKISLLGGTSLAFCLSFFFMDSLAVPFLFGILMSVFVGAVRVGVNGSNKLLAWLRYERQLAFSNKHCKELFDKYTSKEFTLHQSDSIGSAQYELWFQAYKVLSEEDVKNDIVNVLLKEGMRIDEKSFSNVVILTAKELIKISDEKCKKITKKISSALKRHCRVKKLRKQLETLCEYSLAIDVDVEPDLDEGYLHTLNIRIKVATSLVENLINRVFSLEKAGNLGSDEYTVIEMTRYKRINNSEFTKLKNGIATYHKNQINKASSSISSPLTEIAISKNLKKHFQNIETKTTASTDSSSDQNDHRKTEKQKQIKWSSGSLNIEYGPDTPNSKVIPIGNSFKGNKQFVFFACTKKDFGGDDAICKKFRAVVDRAQIVGAKGKQGLVKESSIRQGNGHSFFSALKAKPLGANGDRRIYSEQVVAKSGGGEVIHIFKPEGIVLSAHKG